MIKAIILVCSLMILSIAGPIQIKVSFPETPFSKNDLDDYNSIRLRVDSKSQYIYPNDKNLFSLPRLANRKHFVEIVSSVYLFPILLIDQKPMETDIHLLHPVTRKIIRKVSQPIITPLERIQYFQPESSFSIQSFLFSGTGLFLMMGVFMLICYKQVMPKLQEAQEAPEA